jgi:3-deoxy-D-manno-octulosonic-acid transferase
MRSLYNVVFTVFFCLAAPYYFLKMWRRGNWRLGFRQRFCRYSAKVKQSLTNSHVIWFHAVSVGEVNVCTQLIAALEPRVPNTKIVVSTTTSTGMGELQRKLPSHIVKIYYPIDRKRWVHRALSIIHPEAVVLVEAEIWPNFLWRAKKRGTPVFLVNARLSDRSWRGYKRLGFLFRPLFGSLEGVGAQTEADAAKLADHKWLYYRLGELGLDRLSTEGAAERGKAVAPDIAAPLIAAVVKTTGIVKLETIEPMITNKAAFKAGLETLQILPLGQAVA